MFFSRLNDFVQLVDQMLLSHLVYLLRNSLEMLFYKGVEVSIHSGEGFFKTFLVFNSEGDYDAVFYIAYQFYFLNIAHL